MKAATKTERLAYCCADMLPNEAVADTNIPAGSAVTQMSPGRPHVPRGNVEAASIAKRLAY